MAPRIDPSWLLGCDVSKFQIDVDFPRLKAAGVAFGYVREAEGFFATPDDRWTVNWKGMHAAGIPCGPYYPPHDGDGREQAKRMRGWCGDWEHGRDLRPSIDFEVKGTSLKTAEDMARGILDLFGVLPLIYGGKWFFREVGLARSSILASCPLWLADYEDEPHLPDAFDDWAVWQCNPKGRLDGVPTDVDINVVRSRATLDLLLDVSRVGPAEVPRADAVDGSVTLGAQEGANR